MTNKALTGHAALICQKLPSLKLATGQEKRTQIGLMQVNEPQVIRHFVRLSNQNYSIDGGFYPLGSCTMKHNPRLNEKMARLPGFANIHPTTRPINSPRALELMYDLQNWLAKLTGLEAVCLAPAAGAQGELSGILVIRQALLKRGEKRKIILIPDSAHGTNPATAAMCGYEIKVVNSDKDGLVDFTLLQELVAKHTTDIAAIMLTIQILAVNLKKMLKKLLI